MSAAGLSISASPFVSIPATPIDAVTVTDSSPMGSSVDSSRLRIRSATTVATSSWLRTRTMEIRSMWPVTE